MEPSIRASDISEETRRGSEISQPSYEHQAKKEGVDEVELVSPRNPTEQSKGPPPPIEDLAAWIQAAAGFCVLFLTWGLLNSFGSFSPTS